MVKDVTDLDRLIELYVKDYCWTDEEEIEVKSLKAKIESWESLFTTLTNENKKLEEELEIYKGYDIYVKNSKQLEQLKNLVSEIEKLVDKHELVAGIKIEQILQKHKQSGWLFEPKLGELKRQ